MKLVHSTALVVLIAAVALALTACPQAAAPAATATPTTAPPTPTRPPATPTPLPPTPTRASAVATPVAAAGVSPSDLAAKARANTEYSFEGRITSAAQTINMKGYVKATKQRQELSTAGTNTVMIVDGATKTAYMYFPDRKMATKIDFSQAAATAQQVAGLPSDARFVGMDTVDGKPGAVYEVPSVNAKFWIWTERGVPLKGEVGSGAGRSVVEFTNYQFGPQPDNLFQLPPGTQVSDTALPIPGKVPIIPTP